MLLTAKAISYPDGSRGAAAGVSFNETLKQLGIADQLQPKIKLAQGGADAMSLVTEGEADIGLTFLSEMDEPRRGRAVTAQNFHPYILWLGSSPGTASVYKAHGMQATR